MLRVTPKRRVELRLLRDKDHYDDLIANAVAGSKVAVWISTANVKDLRVEAPVGSRARARGSYISILEVFSGLRRRGVELRLLHAGLPSRAFRAALEKAKLNGPQGLAMRQCPRVHLKMIAIDGALLYLGSANFTGAGLGAKGEGRRNFEAGIVTDDDVMLDEMQATFEAIWSGRSCKGCKLRSVCPKPLDELDGSPPQEGPKKGVTPRASRSASGRPARAR